MQRLQASKSAGLNVLVCKLAQARAVCVRVCLEANLGRVKGKGGASSPVQGDGRIIEDRCQAATMHELRYEEWHARVSLLPRPIEENYVLVTEPLQKLNLTLKLFSCCFIKLHHHLFQLFHGDVLVFLVLCQPHLAKGALRTLHTTRIS